MNKYKEAINELKEVLYLPDKYLEKRLNILQELVEKATPKKPKESHYASCSSCGGLVFGSYNYCHKCGQALDWSQEEEE